MLNDKRISTWMVNIVQTVTVFLDCGYMIEWAVDMQDILCKSQFIQFKREKNFTNFKSMAKPTSSWYWSWSLAFIFTSFSKTYARNFWTLRYIRWRTNHRCHCRRLRRICRWGWWARLYSYRWCSYRHLTRSLPSHSARSRSNNKIKVK